MLGLHLVLVTLHRGLQLVLSKQLELVTLNTIFSVVLTIRGPNKLERCPSCNNHKGMQTPCKIYPNTRLACVFHYFATACITFN